MTHVGLGRGKNRSQSPLFVASPFPWAFSRFRGRDGRRLSRRACLMPYSGLFRWKIDESRYHAREKYYAHGALFGEKARSELSDDNKVRLHST